MTACFLRAVRSAFVGRPAPERYAEIFAQYAAGRGAAPRPELVARLLERYRAEGRELRCCEPRDLIERARDICSFQCKPLELTANVLDLAWTGYFGTELPRRLESAADARGDTADAPAQRPAESP